MQMGAWGTERLSTKLAPEVRAASWREQAANLVPRCAHSVLIFPSPVYTRFHKTGSSTDGALRRYSFRHLLFITQLYPPALDL
ncbi:hypothetical protein TREES_T100018690 [Tupaia chinensis]|uniref:Uncharacterized protein n=1 Tax=Tupaia chinensis TaxID=246437 RepID=L9KLN7_TUPCH|nr:hypothetical protein TREES_T100018690 [Tupaia chinensis]